MNKGTRQQAEKALAIKVGSQTRQGVGVGIEGTSIIFDFQSKEGLNRFIETYFKEKEIEKEVEVIVVIV